MKHQTRTLLLLGAAAVSRPSHQNDPSRFPVYPSNSDTYLHYGSNGMLEFRYFASCVEKNAWKARKTAVLATEKIPTKLEWRTPLNLQYYCIFYHSFIYHSYFVVKICRNFLDFDGMK